MQICKADSIIRFGAYENSMICFLPFLPTKSIYFLATSFSITTTTPAFSGESDHCGLRKMTLWKLDCGRKKGFDKALFSFMSLVCLFVFTPTGSLLFFQFIATCHGVLLLFLAALCYYLSKLNHSVDFWFCGSTFTNLKKLAEFSISTIIWQILCRIKLFLL